MTASVINTIMLQPTDERNLLRWVRCPVHPNVWHPVAPKMEMLEPRLLLEADTTSWIAMLGSLPLISKSGRRLGTRRRTFHVMHDCRKIPDTKIYCRTVIFCFFSSAGEEEARSVARNFYLGGSEIYHILFSTIQNGI